MPHVDTTKACLENQVAEKSVAFQFVLDTFLGIFQETLSLEHLISHHFGYPLAAPAFNPQSQKLLVQFYDSLRHLTAETSGYLSSLKDSNQGALVRLCQECQKLSILCPDNQTVAALHELADKAWLEAQQAMHAYVHGEKAVSEPIEAAEVTDNEKATSLKRFPFLSHLIKMIKTIECFSNTWPELLKDFRYDENILFFVARHHENIDALHGAKFVTETLKKLFPDGSATFDDFITKAYLDRGFDHMIPTIVSTIEELGSW